MPFQQMIFTIIIMILACCPFQAKKVKAHNLLKQIVSESHTGFKAKPNAYTQLLGHQQFYAAMFLNQLFNCQFFKLSSFSLGTWQQVFLILV